MFAQIILSSRNILNLFLYTHHIEMQKAKQGIFETSSGFLYMAKLQTDCIEYWFSSLIRKTSIHSECTGEETSTEGYKKQSIQEPGNISRSEDKVFYCHLPVSSPSLINLLPLPVVWAAQYSPSPSFVYFLS